MVVALILSGCAKNIADKNNDLGSGDKSNLPISLTSLIEHAEYCKAIYDIGGDQKDEVAFEVIQDNGISIIVIRGTANEANVLSDIDVRLVKDVRTGIYLHKGFRDAATTIMQIIDTSTTTGRNTIQGTKLTYPLEHTVHVTGHSLGGAVAQIIGMWLHTRGKNVQIFSYGSPKVSSQVLDSQPTHWRVVRRSDPIPFTPP